MYVKHSLLKNTRKYLWLIIIRFLICNPPRHQMYVPVNLRNKNRMYKKPCVIASFDLWILDHPG
ncbi:hypothetical protein HanRHA438_Chr10g0444291 [Helianthus annuus]|nr:hypothetical protein HanRHA438_Chr10g0444291 [Helianthus annuus]